MQPDTPSLKILYVGSLSLGPGGTCFHRMRALQELGHRITAIDTGQPAPRWSIGGVRRILRHRVLGSQMDARVNRELALKARGEEFDVVWIDKGLAIAGATLRGLRRLPRSPLIVGYSPDDMMNPDNQSREFLSSLPFYDLYFTTKTYNVDELKDLGCPRAEFIPNAFDRHLHRPVSVPDSERKTLGGPVGFIGNPEESRARSIAFLSRQGIPVKVWGADWERWRSRFDGRFEVGGGGQFSEAYVRVLCSFDINLAFLRKVNRDLQTTRSMEIPACGSFMLAERTREHLELFEEGKEAEFFADDEELLRKVRYYLDHPEEREAIAAAGRERCLRDGYSNHDRMRTAIERVEELRASPRGA